MHKVKSKKSIVCCCASQNSLDLGYKINSQGDTEAAGIKASHLRTATMEPRGKHFIINHLEDFFSPWPV